MPSIEPYSWVNLVSGTPGFVSNRPETMLGVDEAPTCTGVDMTVPGYLKSGTIPSGTTAVEKTYTISTNTWYLHYRRCWRGSGTQIRYNAPEYTTVVLPQGKGWIDCTHDANSVLAKPLPIGTGGLIFFKGTGAYILPNADNLNGNFGNPKFIQEAYVANITYACSVEGIVYFANGDGLFSVDVQGNVKELSEPIRGNLTAAAITADYNNKYLMIGTAMAYDINTGKFFPYSSSTFLFESRKLHNRDNSNITVSMVDFEFDKTSTSQGNIEFYIQTSERGYGAQKYTLPVRNIRGEEEHVQLTIPPENGRSWQLKITSLPSNLKIKNIWVRAKGYTPESKDS